MIKTRLISTAVDAGLHEADLVVDDVILVVTKAFGKDDTFDGAGEVFKVKAGHAGIAGAASSWRWSVAHQ